MAFDFLAFKCLRTLTVENVCWDADHVTALGTLRTTLTELAVRKCDITSVAAVLALQGGEITAAAAIEWPALLRLDLSWNRLAGLDRDIRLAPGNLTLLNMNQCQFFSRLY